MPPTKARLSERVGSRIGLYPPSYAEQELEYDYDSPEEETPMLEGDGERLSDTDGAYTYYMPPRRDMRKRRVRLSPEKMAMVADFFRERDFLYVKGHMDYRDTPKREEAFYEIAMKAGLTMKEFKQWYATMRTTLSKITRAEARGGPAKRLTEREKNLLATFGFLLEHIVRVPARSGPRKRKVEETPQASKVVTGDEPQQISSEDGWDEAEDAGESSSMSGKHADEMAASQKKTGGKHQLKKIKSRVEEAAYAAVLESLSATPDQQRSIPSSLPSTVTTPSPNQAVKVAWGAWLSATVPHIHDHFWKSYQDESYQRVMWYVTESDKLRAREQQQQQQPLQQQQGAPPPIPSVPPVQPQPLPSQFSSMFSSPGNCS